MSTIEFVHKIKDKKLCIRELDALLPSAEGATIGRGIQGRVVKSDLSPVPFPDGKGCLQAKVNELRDVQMWRFPMPDIIYQIIKKFRVLSTERMKLWN